MDAMQDTTSVAIVIPSRLDRVPLTGVLFLARAIGSARAQVMPAGTQIRVFVGIDADADLPADFPRGDDVTVARTGARSQAAALNAAAAAAADCDFIAFLEDDDQWNEHFLVRALAALRDCDFVSSTQVEVDEDETPIRVNDFATPSGWVMPMCTWTSVGPFDETYRWHLDNEWLGRLTKTGAQRCHLVESTAPVTFQAAAQVRPWLANVIRAGGGGTVAILRHIGALPLVTRLVHSGSGMARIARGGVEAVESHAEYQRLSAAYGFIPW